MIECRVLYSTTNNSFVTSPLLAPYFQGKSNNCYTAVMGFLVRFGLEVNAKSNNCCATPTQLYGR